MSDIARYGVKEAGGASDAVEIACEQLRLLGFATLSSGLAEADLDVMSAAFNDAAERYADDARAKGIDLATIGERDAIRVLPALAPAFWQVVFDDALHRLLGMLLGDYYILNQVNGLINRTGSDDYGQAAWHRDLPYQHFTTSRPIAINALFALDDFTVDNGATRVLPASHRQEAFPSDAVVRATERQIVVPRGSFIVLDAMVYHRGSKNDARTDRRAVNHVFSIPMLRQQIHLPSAIGDASEFSDWQRKVLGFGLDEYRSVDDWLAARADRS